MKITACLAWYDETPATLERCVRSLAGVVDELVAYDGAWRLFPKPETASSDEQQLAIRATAAAERLQVLVHIPNSVWHSQVEKRNHLMRHAAERGADWLFVIDADEYVIRPKPALLRARLEATMRDVALVETEQYSDSHLVRSRWPVRALYRASAGVTVERAHNGYRTADGRWLHGPAEHVEAEPAEDTSALIAKAHDLSARTEARAHARREYRLARRERRAEAWL